MDDDVATAINALPHDYKMALLLVDIQGQTYQEVADMLEVPVGTVMSRLSGPFKGGEGADHLRETLQLPDEPAAEGERWFDRRRGTLRPVQRLNLRDDHPSGLGGGQNGKPPLTARIRACRRHVRASRAPPCPRREPSFQPRRAPPLEPRPDRRARWKARRSRLRRAGQSPSHREPETKPKRRS